MSSEGAGKKGDSEKTALELLMQNFEGAEDRASLREVHFIAESLLKDKKTMWTIGEMMREGTLRAVLDGTLLNTEKKKTQGGQGKLRSTIKKVKHLKDQDNLVKECIDEINTEITKWCDKLKLGYLEVLLFGRNEDLESQTPNVYVECCNFKDEFKKSVKAREIEVGGRLSKLDKMEELKGYYHKEAQFAKSIVDPSLQLDMSFAENVDIHEPFKHDTVATMKVGGHTVTVNLTSEFTELGLQLPPFGMKWAEREGFKHMPADATPKKKGTKRAADGSGPASMQETGSEPSSATPAGKQSNIGLKGPQTALSTVVRERIAARQRAYLAKGKQDAGKQDAPES